MLALLRSLHRNRGLLLRASGDVILEFSLTLVSNLFSFSRWCRITVFPERPGAHRRLSETTRFKVMYLETHCSWDGALWQWEWSEEQL